MTRWHPFIDRLMSSAGSWPTRSRDRAWWTAKLALGERLRSIGFPPAALAAKIAGADASIQQCNVEGRPAAIYRAIRQKLLVELADVALAENTPIPGAEREYFSAKFLEPTPPRSATVAEEVTLAEFRHHERRQAARGLLDSVATRGPAES